MEHACPGFLALILLAIMLVLLARRFRHAWCRTIPRLPKHIRRLHPSTPDDCPLCRLTTIPHEGLLPPIAVRPWRDDRRRRGAPRRVSTDGYACRRPGCAYHGITDSRVHALVADGHQGRTDHIQQCRCQACGTNVSARWGTALSQLKTPPTRIGEVLSALAKGVDIGAAVRVFSHGEATITRWRDRAARHAERVHRHFLHDLHLPHLQVDEIRTRLRARERVTWLWLALDPRTKPSQHLRSGRVLSTPLAPWPTPCGRP